MLATAYQAGIVLGQVDEGATLTVLRGTVALMRTDGSAVQPAPSGTVVHAGDRIATVGPAGALVTFFVGTEIELGSDTTIAVQEVKADPTGRINVTVENVLGSTVHNVATLTGAGSSYQVVAGGTVALVRGTIFGHRRSEDGTITVYLVESNNDFFFPTESNRMYPGEVCSYTPRGDLLCFNAVANVRSPDIWNVLADGDNAGRTDGTFNPGAQNRSEQSHGITNGPDRTNRPPSDDQSPRSDGPTSTSTSTPTPTRTPTPTTTSTATPTTTQGPISNTCTPGPANIVVNSKDDNNIRDAFLTLREALMVANGTLLYADLTPEEKRQVTGGCGGPAVADTITFSSIVFIAMLDPARVEGAPDDAEPTSGLLARAPLAQAAPICVATDLPPISGDTVVGAPGKVEVSSCATGAGARPAAARPSAAGTGFTVSGGTLAGHGGDRFPTGILVNGSTVSTVQGNVVTGLGASTGVGIQIAGTAANRVLGNVVGNNGTGILVLPGANANIIQGNFVGTNLAGTAAVANGIGIQVGGANNTIGGTTAGAGERHFRQHRAGHPDPVRRDRQPDPGQPDRHQRGRDRGHRQRDRRPGHRQQHHREHDPGERRRRQGGRRRNEHRHPDRRRRRANTISGNSVGASGTGIKIDSGAQVVGRPTGNQPRANGARPAAVDNNVVQGNTVGFVLGGAPMPNRTGIDVTGGSNLVGGTGTGAGNVITRSTGIGLKLDGPNSAWGNTIGSTSDSALGNGAADTEGENSGVKMTGVGPTLGGPESAKRNVIANNKGPGVLLENATNYLIQSNEITANGQGSNGGPGVLLQENVTAGTIGCRTDPSTVCESTVVIGPIGDSTSGSRRVTSPSESVAAAYGDAFPIVRAGDLAPRSGRRRPPGRGRNRCPDVLPDRCDVARRPRRHVQQSVALPAQHHRPERHPRQHRRRHRRLSVARTGPAELLDRERQHVPDQHHLRQHWRGDRGRRQRPAQHQPPVPGLRLCRFSILSLGRGGVSTG